MAPITEFALKRGLLKAELGNVDAIQTIALAQFTDKRLADSQATTALVIAIWKGRAPSIELAARIRLQAQRYHRHIDCHGAQALYDIAHDMAVKAAGDRHGVTVGIMADLTKLYRVNGRASRIAPLYERMAAALDAAPAIGAQTPALLLDLSDLAYQRRHFVRAERYARAALAYVDTGAAAHAHSRISALLEHAAALYALGRLDQGDKQRDRARQLVSAAGGKLVVSPTVLSERAGGVVDLYRRGDVAGAIKKVNQELSAANAQESRLSVAYNSLKLAPQEKTAASKKARNSEARNSALDEARGALRAQQKLVTTLLAMAGELYHSEQRLAEAEPLYRRALAMLDARRAGNSHQAGRVSYALGVLLRSKGMLAEAEELQQRAYAIAEADLGADHPNATEAQAELAYLATAQGKLTQAAGHYTALVAIERRRAPVERGALGRYLMGLADAQLKLGDAAGAEVQLKMVHELWRTGATRHDAVLVNSLNGLAALYAGQGRAVEARRVKAELAALHGVH